MLKSFPNTFSSTFKAAYLKVVAVILVITLIGLPVVGNYGLSVDEGTEIAMVRRNIEFIAKGTPIPGDLKYFGYEKSTGETMLNRCVISRSLRIDWQRYSRELLC